MPAHRGDGSRGREVGGRRLLSLKGGNRGVVAQDAVLLSCYGESMLELGWRSARTVVHALVCAASTSVSGG